MAVALSQVVITAALVVGTAVVDQAMVPGQGPAATTGGLLAGIGLLLLASLGLPITLGVVPIAVDAAVAAGAGRAALGSARSHAEGVRGALSQPAGASAHHRLATAPARALRGGVRLATGAALGPAAPRPGGRWRRGWRPVSPVGPARWDPRRRPPGRPRRPRTGPQARHGGRCPGCGR